MERELQMVQLSAIRCNCMAILWISLVSFAECLLLLFISLSTQSGNFWRQPRNTLKRDEMHEKYLAEILRGGNHAENLHVDRNIILKCIIKEQNRSVRTGFILV